MARPLRIELSGGLYHVTSRGDRREDIFFSEGDRRTWLDIFGQVCERFNWVCHAYCQMTNHYHIVVETPEGNLSQGMRQLNGVYTQSVNRTHGRVGHVFQGRFTGILVEKDAYLLELSRYVVLNPVRAGMVADSRDWRWSSYRATLGEEAVPKWLETDWVLGQFAADREQAIHRYVDFVRMGVGLPSLWENLKNQIYLGGESFLSDIQPNISSENDLREVPRRQRRPLAKPLGEYVLEGLPYQAMAKAYLSGDYSMKEIADFFGVHYATVSRAVKRFETEMH
ncbi:MAG: transposase [Rhodocyclales bacterium]|nr:transposase [Rhodocyclales bacterium]